MMTYVKLSHRNPAISDSEISDAINKALSDHNSGTFIPRPDQKPVVKDGKATLLKSFVRQNHNRGGSLGNSQIRYGRHHDDAVLLLQTLYKKKDFIWAADRHEPGTKCQRFIQFVNGLILSKQVACPPFFIINPLTGLRHQRKSGDGLTYRGDGNIKTLKYCMMEFDNLQFRRSNKFFSGNQNYPLLLIYSGNKSIHAS